MKKVLFILVIVASVFIINNLIRSIYSLWQKQHLLVNAQKELAEEKKRNEALKKQLQVVESKEFVEKEARDKLFLAKPGESQVIIPRNASNSSQIEENKEKVVEEANWKQWWNVFFSR